MLGVAEDPWLDDEELAAWRPVGAMLVLLPTRLDDAVAPFGLSFFEYAALAVLERAPDQQLSTTWLARMANGSLSRMSHATRRLERRGLVERTTSSTDRRVTIVSLTEVGRAELERAAPAHAAAVRSLVVDVLGAEQLAAFGEASAVIVDRLQPGGPPPER